MPDAQQAFDALVDLAQRSRASARGLPAQVDVQSYWSGIGFMLMGHRMVVPLGEVSEMLEVPPYTHLPGVQPWVRGVANVRGRLLPIFDMASFFGGHLSTRRKQRRVLILETDELYTGLLVDQVFGMQHFPSEAYREESGLVDAEIAPYTDGCYEHKELGWTVFRPALLAQDPRFINAARG